jgi:hypothetical protein
LLNTQSDFIGSQDTDKASQKPSAHLAALVRVYSHTRLERVVECRPLLEYRGEQEKQSATADSPGDCPEGIGIESAVGIKYDYIGLSS